jgi:tRNA modification GTPase
VAHAGPAYHTAGTGNGPLLRVWVSKGYVVTAAGRLAAVPGCLMYDDLIAAIATAQGEAGIGIVRLSGPGAADLAGRVVRARPGGRPVGAGWLPSHRLRHGYLVDPADGRLIDEVMVVRMAPPRSYTREEVVELHTHGGPVAVREALALALRQGARLAEPGEFTLRAFLNGRLDLSQAEAVMQVITARTPQALALAVDALGGRFRRELGPARAPLLAALAWLEASVDFPEDEVPPADPAADLRNAAGALAALLARASAGALYREGITVVLAGRPNVGKSSLMNALLRYERAIVTPVAGTTRDTLAERLNVRGIPVTLTDTAGLADTDDAVERLGVARSRQALALAGLIILVLDAAAPLTPADRVAIDEVRSLASGDGAEPAERRPVLVALNKCDLPARIDEATVRAALAPFAIVRTSAVTGAGLAALEEASEAAVLGGAARAQADPALLTARQEAALHAALGHVRGALAALAAGLPPDVVAVDVRAALTRLGEITGESVTETLLDEIFARFCIGK